MSSGLERHRLTVAIDGGVTLRRIAADLRSRVARGCLLYAFIRNETTTLASRPSAVR